MFIVHIFWYFQEGLNKQSVATVIQMSPDGGYIGIGWEGTASDFKPLPSK